MKKTKPCRGIGKAINYSGCGNEVIPSTRKFGLCRSCYPKWLFSDDINAIGVRESFLISNKKKVEQENRTNEKKEKEKIVDWKQRLQDKINLISRLIDIGLPCLAKGVHAPQMHGGHIYSRGSSPNIRYNLHNIHRQGAQSNHFQNDDGLLREGLTKEYGLEYFEFVSSLRQTPQVKYSNEEYHEIYKSACKIANDLKKSGNIYPSTEERISLRNRLNIELGIYDMEFCEFKTTIK